VGGRQKSAPKIKEFSILDQNRPQRRGFCEYASLIRAITSAFVYRICQVHEEATDRRPTGEQIRTESNLFSAYIWQRCLSSSAPSHNFDFDVPNKSTLEAANRYRMASRYDLFSMRTLINKIAAALPLKIAILDVEADLARNICRRKDALEMQEFHRSADWIG